MMEARAAQRVRRRAAVGAAACWSLCALCLALLPAAAVAAPAARSIPSLQAEAARVRAEVQRLDRRAAVAVEKYDLARAELDLLNGRLGAARRDLSRAEAALDAAQARLGERLSDMYKRGTVGLLDVLLSTDDLAEVDTQLGYFRLISQADEEAVTGIETLARDVATITRGIERDRAAALKKEMDLRQKQADVEDQIAERRALLAELDGRVRGLIERQARLDAAESRRLARAAGVDLARLSGGPTQIALIRETMKYLGIPYVWGGATPAGGFDCSGLVLYVYARFGVAFPHGATMQAHMGAPVPLTSLQPADLVFFGSPSFYHHVGIYIGNGLFIEAPHTGDVVKVSRLAGRGCTLACRYRIQAP